MPSSTFKKIGFFVKADPKPSGSLNLNIKGPNLSCTWGEARDPWTAYTRIWRNFTCTEVGAVGIVTITDFTKLNTGDKVTLVATDGTEWDFVCGDQSSVNGTWESTSSNHATAINLMNVINTSSGPAGTRFSARTIGPPFGFQEFVTITQSEGGPGGNTTITLTDPLDGMSKTDFTGGLGTAGFSSSTVPFVVPSPANKITSTGFMPLYQPVYETTGVINSSVNLYTAGPIPVTSNIPLYLQGSLTPSGTVSLYVKGHSVTEGPYGPSVGMKSSSFSLYADGVSKVAITDTLSFFLKPEETGTVTSQMPLWTKGIGAKLNKNVNLYIQNMQISGSVPLHTEGFFTTVSVPFATIAATRNLTQSSIQQKTSSTSKPTTTVSTTPNATVFGPTYNATVASVDSTYTVETVADAKVDVYGMNLFVKNVGSSGALSLSIPSGHIDVSGLVTLFASGALVSTGTVDLVIPSPSASASGMMAAIITGYV